EGPAESWPRPISFAEAAGVAEVSNLSGVLGAGAALGAETWKFWELGCAAALSPARDAAGCDKAGAGAAALPVDCARGKVAITADARNRNIAAPLAKVENVRSGASQTGTETRGTSDREGTGIGRAAMSRAVPRSSARRVRQSAHVSRCACTLARASDESAPSRYAERSPKGCTA